jgi:putative peptide zinc metalloprotease protein
MREPPRLSLRSRVTLHELVIRAEADDWIVGRNSTGQFVELPQLGVTAIGLLSQGRPLGEIQDELAADPDEAVEIVEFVEQLAELGFVRSIDDIEVEDPAADEQDQLEPSLPWIRPAQVRWLFGGPALAGYAAVTAAAIAALVIWPRLLPGYNDLLISRSPTTVVVADTVITLILMGGHELAHLFAARSVDVPARISWGTRLFDLVAQTAMPGVWAVSTRQRMRCYLAGLGLEVVLASALILVEASGLPGAADHLARAAVALLLLGITTQFLVYTRTDVYFVLADLLRARNLHDDASVYLLSRAAATRRWLGRGRTPAPVTERSVDREHRLVRYYAWFMLAGSAASTLALAAFVAPAVIRLISRSYTELTAGLAHADYLSAADAGAALLIVIGSWAFFLIVFIRSRGPWWRRLQASRSS